MTEGTADSSDRHKLLDKLRDLVARVFPELPSEARGEFAADLYRMFLAWVDAEADQQAEVLEKRRCELVSKFAGRLSRERQQRLAEAATFKTKRPVSSRIVTAALPYSEQGEEAIELDQRTREDVANLIRTFIRTEDPNHPMSDKALRGMLNTRKPTYIVFDRLITIDLTENMVKTFREAAGIPDAATRRDAYAKNAHKGAWAVTQFGQAPKSATRAAEKPSRKQGQD